MGKHAKKLAEWAHDALKDLEPYEVEALCQAIAQDMRESNDYPGEDVGEVIDESDVREYLK